MKSLTDIDIKQHLSELDPAWKINKSKICREIVFKDFVQAFAFMCSIALIAEKMVWQMNMSLLSELMTMVISGFALMQVE